jgi:hypothetical protein
VVFLSVLKNKFYSLSSLYFLTIIYIAFCYIFIAGWSSPVARQAHNLKVVSSNLAPATKIFLHLLLNSVISGSIGFPTTEKIAQVLENYKQLNQLLIGAFALKI